MDRSALDLYATLGGFTDLVDVGFAGTDVAAVVEVVQGLLIYDVVAQPFYGVELSPDQAEAIHERDSARLLAMVRAIHDGPLTEARARRAQSWMSLGMSKSTS